MAKRDEMREALDQLRMLTGEGMFENKEAPWSALCSMRFMQW